MKAIITEVTIEFNESKYKVNLYYAPRWKVNGIDIDWVDLMEKDVPIEVVKARHRAQSA